MNGKSVERVEKQDVVGVSIKRGEDGCQWKGSDGRKVTRHSVRSVQQRGRWWLSGA